MSLFPPQRNFVSLDLSYGEQWTHSALMFAAEMRMTVNLEKKKNKAAPPLIPTLSGFYVSVLQIYLETKHYCSARVK